MKRCLGVVSLCVIAGVALLPRPTGAAEPLSPELQQRFRDAALFVHFQGKGSCLPYDGGVIKEASRRIPALVENRVVIGGNSSGSLLAIYFAVHGFAPRSVSYAEYRLKRGDVAAVRKAESSSVKMVKLLRKQPTEVSMFTAMREFVGFALGVDDWRSARSFGDIARRSKARLQLPVVIIAANKEVIDNRVPGSDFDARGHKVFDARNFSVSWKADVYEYYRQHPAQFERDHPNLRLGATAYIGKACTMFVDPMMYALLSQIPAAERLGDLRLITTPDDMAMAIEASVAEPTYFDPVAERSPDRLLVDDTWGNLGNSKRRIYCGGFTMTMAAQDQRRMLPGLRVLGTGWSQTPAPGRSLLKSWYLLDMEPVSELNSWWADMEITPAHDDQVRLDKHTLSNEEEFRLGEETAARYFDKDHSRSRFVRRPDYHYPATAAIWPEQLPVDMFLDASEKGPRAELKTWRGMGPLLARPQ
ncbi:MAG: hypothetical protein JSS27_06410 [Planctomycetes bacterium]|nr:hypothetical protein [Planctomycetota bacterium]